jgi:hypothetical protein
VVHFHFSVVQEVQVKGEIRNGNRDSKEHVPYPISLVHILNPRKRSSHLVNKYVLFPYFALKKETIMSFTQAYTASFMLAKTMFAEI